jgi:hypothetical protein
MLEHLCVDLEQESIKQNKRKILIIYMQNSNIWIHSRTAKDLNWEKLFSVLKWSGRLFHNVDSFIPPKIFFYLLLLFKCCFMLEHLCVDLEQESKGALATWVLVQIYTQSSLSKTKANFYSSTCITATFGPIPGLQKTWIERSYFQCFYWLCWYQF